MFVDGFDDDGNLINLTNQDKRDSLLNTQVDIHLESDPIAGSIGHPKQEKRTKDLDINEIIE